MYLFILLHKLNLSQNAWLGRFVTIKSIKIENTRFYIKLDSDVKRGKSHGTEGMTSLDISFR